MKSKIYIFQTAEKLALAVADDFAAEVQEAANRGHALTIVLSGGSTPKRLFALLYQPPFSGKIDWRWVHLFWSDERCVPPDHPGSNFGMTRKVLLAQVDIPPENIHRIRGEAKPTVETERYSQEILKFVPAGADGIPRFDRIFLGMGSDGHTASLFPGSPALRVNDKICTVATHPQSGQKRITLTLPVINRAARVTFLIAGKNKHRVVQAILSQNEIASQYPAAMVAPQDGRLEWYLDRGATS